MSSELDEVLSEVDEGIVSPPYLLWGEEFLVRLRVVVPPGDRRHGPDIVAGPLTGFGVG